MENINDRLENIEQILELLISEVKLNSGALGTNFGTKIQDMQKVLLDRLVIIENLPSEDSLNDLRKNLHHVSLKLKEMPEVFKVRHQHRIEVHSKFRAAGLFCAIFLIILAISGSLFLISKNVELQSGSDKFLVVQGAYPKLALAINNLYSKDPDKLLDSARMQIRHRQDFMEAILREREAKLEYEKAKRAKNDIKDAKK